MSERNKILYIHGRPSGHPIHDDYANIIKAEFLPEDYMIPYLEKYEQYTLVKYISFFFNAIFLGVKCRNIDIILTECVRFPVMLSYMMGILPSNLKKVALFADESLYFTYSKKYSKPTIFLMHRYLLSMDYVICVGAYQEELAKEILPPLQHFKVHRIFNGLKEDLLLTLNQNYPDFKIHRWIFIGNINASFRVYYKGVDLMINALEKIDSSISWTLDLVGAYTENIKQELLASISDRVRSRINFLGVQSIPDIIHTYSLGIHVARGDSFPTSVIELTAAGIPTIVSQETGTKEILGQIDSSYIVPLDASAIANQITIHIQKSIEVKNNLSEKCKSISIKYNVENARTLFIETIQKIRNEI